MKSYAVLVNTLQEILEVLHHFNREMFGETVMKRKQVMS
jgi:hypothetical protein